MQWVIQNNLYREYGYQALMDTLKRLELPTFNVKVVPILDRLIPADFDTHSYYGDFSDVPEPDINDNELVMVCGTITLVNIGKRRGWKPASFMNENFHYSVWKQFYGDNLLNADSIVGKFGELKSPWNDFFVRPCADTKAFTGEVSNVVKFDLWRNDLLSLPKNDMWMLDEDTEIVISPLKEIYSEYRCFVVDGKVVTTSRYKMGNVVRYVDDISGELLNFAQSMVDMWQPARAFVIDVAETSEGFKIVEINNLNSAGFYACNVPLIVHAIEMMEF